MSGGGYELLLGIAAPIALFVGSLVFVLEATRSLEQGANRVDRRGRLARILLDMRVQGVVLAIFGVTALESTWLIDHEWLRRVVLGLAPVIGGIFLGRAVAKDAQSGREPGSE